MSAIPAFTRDSWLFLETFRMPPLQAGRDWNAISQMQKGVRTALAPIRERFEGLQENWKHKLLPLCGDSLPRDWSDFRPLRVSREEDWSDWLAWLLKTSITGFLAEALFGVQTK
jgi:hypothetical protein